MMKVETRESEGQVLLTVEGKLTAAWVETLEECWRHARQQHPHSRFLVELTGVTSVDKCGWYLLRLMHRDGVSVVASGLMNEDIKDRITSQKV